MVERGGMRMFLERKMLSIVNRIWYLVSSFDFGMAMDVGKHIKLGHAVVLLRRCVQSGGRLCAGNADLLLHLYEKAECGGEVQRHSRRYKKRTRVSQLDMIGPLANFPFRSYTVRVPIVRFPEEERNSRGESCEMLHRPSWRCRIRRFGL
ncbi:hypothetical protein BCR34DRAFT_350279 [Clohesyomyces aquaticus]|uniref:Uncharacterized protein n=1 Tax=Clohesyomyces aquaticus TaxID=1231657 RepID=A0A1Y1ZJH6_9PLEO|nr:hypothetical protein BCR34DRAFT_350279 [Clohesyomyces aquaticus]